MKNGLVMLVVSGTNAAGMAYSYKRALEALGLGVFHFDLEAERRKIAPLGRVGHRVMAHVDLASFNARATFERSSGVVLFHLF